MTDAALKPGTQDIVVDEVFPHTPQMIWKTLTTGELIARWFKMPMEGFAPVKGTRFTYRTAPAGAWDGIIRCEVLEVIANERLAYAWTGGDDANTGYGSRLNTIVTFTLSPAEGGTRLRLVHSGFVLPRNETAYQNMSGGWKAVIRTIDAVTGEVASSEKPH